MSDEVLSITALAISHAIEMKRIVDQYQCGVVSENFSPKSLATKLNNLDEKQIFSYKQQSHKAANILNAESIFPRLREIVEDLLS